MESRSVLPAPSAEAADWSIRDDVSWSDLVRYGPPGFGCSEVAAKALTDSLPAVTRRVRYGEPAPMFRDPD